MKHNPLARGLASLLEEEGIFSSDSTDNLVQEIDISLIRADINQPRKYFNQEKINELARSIEEYGVIQPIILQRLDGEKLLYEIIAGERRFRASKIAGLVKIPAIVKQNLNDCQKNLEIALIENIQRNDLSPIEEAKAIDNILKQRQYTQNQLATKLGKSRSHIANILRLNNLHPSIQVMLEENKISIGHAKCLVNLDSEFSISLAEKIIDKKLSVRDLEYLISKYKNKKDFKVDLKNDEIKSKAKNLRNNIQIDSKEIKTIEEIFEKELGLKTKICSSNDSKKGRVVINFDSLNELDAILEKITKN